MSSIYKFNPEDAKRFANERGIRTFTRGDELQFFKCPYCGEYTNDKHTFAINLKTGMFKCMRASCDAHGNMITLARDFGFSLGTDADAYYGNRTRYRDLKKYPVPETRSAAVEYLASRGISKAITEKYNVTTRKDNDGVIVFPFYDETGALQFVKYRKADFVKGRDKNKEWCEVGCKPILFGMNHCTESGTLILTEGQIDSLSVAEAGIPNAVSVPTGANGFTWVPYCWDFLSKYNTLIVFGDHEDGHITLLDEMKNRFHGTVRHVRPEDYLDCKDANEILQKHGKEAVRHAVEYAVTVEHPRIKKLSDVTHDTDRIFLDTGLPKLNRILGGFSLGQMVLLTGERGFGKSTLGSQFVAMAIKQGYTAFLYSGELPDWFVQEWFDRQMAGGKHINTVKTRLEFYDFRVNAEDLDRIHHWYSESCYIYDGTIADDDGDEIEALDSVIETAIKQYGCQVIFVDNLMTAMTDDMATDLYRQQGAFVKRLSGMAKKYNVLIILVAHPRKSQPGGHFNNDDIAGSSNVTNLADTILRYTKPEEDDDDPLPADRLLQITKNRLTGKTEDVGIKLWYDEKSKRISETKDFDWTMGWEDVPDGFIRIEGELEDIPF